MRLKDKVAIVTGAASGMGAATAKLFAREGAKVVVVDRLTDEGAKIVLEISDEGGEARFQVLDVTRDGDWETLVADTISAYGQLDILVNNAGVSGSHPDRLNIDTWDEQMNVNAKGVFLGMRAVIPTMQKAGRGSIVNISSISGFVGQRFVHMGYNAAKGAVRLATKAAAVQFARDGVRVNSVHPGVMPAMRTSQLTADPDLRKKNVIGDPGGARRSGGGSRVYEFISRKRRGFLHHRDRGFGGWGFFSDVNEGRRLTLRAFVGKLGSLPCASASHWPDLLITDLN
jgi:NAD(P)-dependent dehydrogenase (short-subunit alcohol dehydrogenase family)